jgi:hypothetical protein
MVIQMNKYAYIEKNIVVNVVVADEEFAKEQNLVVCSEGGPGWSYNGSTFSPPTRDVSAEWASVRTIRDEFLISSDFNVLPDRWAAMSAEVQAAWTKYRQDLRDIPKTFDDPLFVNFPAKPSSNN